MAEGLTRRQSDLLDILRRLPKTPTYQEMCEHLGYASRAGVVRLIEALEERGYIERIPNRARAIRVLDKPRAWHNDLADFSTGELRRELERRGAVQ
jgi:repressor LexA